MNDLNDLNDLFIIYINVMFLLSLAIIMSLLFHFYLFENIEFSGMECLIFGSLISATDPVSTLAVFSAVSAEPMLTMLV